MTGRKKTKEKNQPGDRVSLLGLGPHFFQILERYVTAEKTAQWLP
jgi:hypothetical protein